MTRKEPYVNPTYCIDCDKENILPKQAANCEVELCRMKKKYELNLYTNLEMKVK